MSALDDFIARLYSEVLDRVSAAEGTAAVYKETAFTELAVELLTDPIGKLDNPVVCYFEGQVGRGLAKANGYCLSEDQESLDLIVTIFKGTGSAETVTTEDVKKAVSQVLRYFEGALSGLHSKLEPLSDSFEMTARVHSARASLKRLRIYVVTDGVASAKAKSQNFPVSGLDAVFEVWDAERFSRATAAGRPQDEIDADLVALSGQPVPCVQVPSTSADYQVYVTALSGELVYRLFEEFGTQLLERNVRSFLQAKAKINRGIRETIMKTPEMFMAYNNGLSLTAESIETIDTKDGLALTRVRGLQVVNGGQTASSLHRAGRAKVDLSRVHVQAKLTVITPERLNDVAPLIARFANTQNPIQMADFSANDPFHIELERLAEQVWVPGERGKWFYERARGQYQDAKAAESQTSLKAKQFHERTPPGRRFSKTDLAKYLSSWNQWPHRVSLGNQKNFVIFMQHVAETYPKDWLPDVKFFKELVAKAILFNEVTRMVRDKGFQSYKANIVTYTVALLAHRTGGQCDLEAVWNNQRLSVALETMLKEWMQAVAEAITESAEGRNVTEWCKKEQCWQAVRRVSVVLPAVMPLELQRVVVEGSWGGPRTETRVALDPDELNAIATCRSVSAEQWIRILSWASESGSLDSRQRELVGGFASNAAGGWTKELSPRKAQEGRSILKLASDSGVGEPDDEMSRLEQA